MKSKITVTGANIVFFSFAALFIVFQFLMGIPMAIYGEKFLDDHFIAITIFSEYGLILVPVIVYVLIKRLNVREIFRINNPGLVPCLLITVMSIFAYYVANSLNVIVAFLLQYIGKLPETPIPAPQNLKELFVLIFVISVTPAICEEALNRGIMLKAYEKRGTMKAVIITAMLFGIFHFDITNLVGPIFLGFLIGYYVVKTNSIFSGMLAHFLNNTIALLFLFFTRNMDIPENTRISPSDLAGSTLMGIVFLVVLIGLFILFNKVTEKKYTFVPSISRIKGDVIAIISHWPMIVVLSLYFLITLLVLLSIAAGASK